jgi:protein tyrosine phosphatase (PTP) superfamily phosphohydrolase (DUF442 family)
MVRLRIAVRILLALVIAAGAAGAVCQGRTVEYDEVPRPAGPRPERWAQPLSLPGCPNLHRVSDVLYRGAQPTAEGMKELRRLGIRTVVNLRSFGSDRDEIEGSGGGLGYEHIYMKAWHAEDHEVVRFLKIVADPARQPVFVHCQHGADRTGTMCAMYRIFLQGWSRDDATAEMRWGGYGFHEVWGNLLRYIRGLDVDSIRRQAGLQETRPSAPGTGLAPAAPAAFPAE